MKITKIRIKNFGSIDYKELDCDSNFVPVQIGKNEDYDILFSLFEGDPFYWECFTETATENTEFVVEFTMEDKYFVFTHTKNKTLLTINSVPFYKKIPFIIEQLFPFDKTSERCSVEDTNIGVERCLYEINEIDISPFGEDLPFFIWANYATEPIDVERHRTFYRNGINQVFILY